MSSCAGRDAIKNRVDDSRQIEELADIAAPGSDAEASDAEAIDSRTDLNIYCSVSALALATSIAESYEERFGVTVDVTAYGRETSIQAAEDRECDLALISGSDGIDGLNMQLIGFDGVKIISNHNSGFENIARQDAVDLFTAQTAQIDTKPVNLVVLGKDAPARLVFEEIFPVSGKVNGRMKSLIPGDALALDSEDEVITAVASDDAAIGFISTANSADAVRALTVDGKSAADVGAYPAKRDVVLAYTDDKAIAVKGLFEFLQGEGSEILARNGVLPL
jgi:ABC-type phosphate transport system substrate-binding protein